MGRPAKTERNVMIYKMLALDKQLSYSDIADVIGTTRYAVSGVAFRKRHPRKSVRSIMSDEDRRAGV